MGDGSLFVCDKELAKILNVSQSTVTRSAKGLHNDILTNLHPVVIGGARRWRKKDVAEALGLSVEEINSCI